MLELQYPWLLALIALPFIVLLLTPKKDSMPAVLRVPNLRLWQGIVDESGPTVNQRRRWPIASLLAWICLCAAAANPTWYGQPVEQQAEGRDILLAVDISGSMQVRDMSLYNRWVDRLTATKAVISEFIANRRGDRVGLILYGSEAYMHVPLTTDTDTLVSLLNEAQIGFAGRETAIGDAIGLGLKRLHSLTHDQRIMILLTDGNNTAGTMDPIEAANLAKEQDLKIYTVGIGSRQGMMGLFRSSNDSSVDQSTLNQIAAITGGQAFRAQDTSQLNEIYQYIDELEPTPDLAESIRPQRSLAFWPIIAALAISLLSALIQGLRRGIFSHA